MGRRCRNPWSKIHMCKTEYQIIWMGATVNLVMKKRGRYASHRARPMHSNWRSLSRNTTAVSQDTQKNKNTNAPQQLGPGTPCFVSLHSYFGPSFAAPFRQAARQFQRESRERTNRPGRGYSGHAARTGGPAAARDRSICAPTLYCFAGMWLAQLIRVAVWHRHRQFQLFISTTDGVAAAKCCLVFQCVAAKSHKAFLRGAARGYGEVSVGNVASTSPPPRCPIAAA